jgi:hypothetical protein
VKEIRDCRQESYKEEGAGILFDALGLVEHKRVV